MATEEGKEFKELLKEHLQKEFPFLMGIGMTAEDDSWVRAAEGITEKMGFQSEWRTGPYLMVTFTTTPALEVVPEEKKPGPDYSTMEAGGSHTAAAEESKRSRKDRK